MAQVLNLHAADKQLAAWLKLRDDPPWLRQRRMDAWAAIGHLPPPPLKYSLGVGSMLSAIEIESLPGESCTQQVQGIGVYVTKGSAAFQRKELFSLLSPNENKLTALHAALLGSVTIIEIPEGAALKDPIVLASSLPAIWSSDHVVIIARKNSSAILSDEAVMESAIMKTWRTQGVEIIVEENASLVYANMQALPSSVNQVSYHVGQVHRGAKLVWIEGNFGCTELFARTQTDLCGEGSSVNHQSIFFGCTEQRYDLEGVIHHRSPDSCSNLIAKGVLRDSAKSIYRGLIKMHANARGCRGVQREDTLLMANTAEADAIPVLEIDNNEVACSHSATVGKLDPELLFYMRSRGMAEGEAKRLLMLAFFTPILSQIQHKVIEEKMLHLIRERIG